jgi:polysaccharide chain length determinant protein (PEP-CTERM system associated)
MQQDLSEFYFYIKGTLKYKKVALIFALVVSFAAWAFVFTMEDKYESKAKVHIDSATVIRPLMRGMVIDPDVSSLIRIIQQLMFTRPNLEKIIELSDLKRVYAGGPISNDAIDKLKKEISIAAAGDRDIFDIAYASHNPDLSKSVVQAVLTVFSEQAQGKALADASDAQKFIEQQLRDYEIRLQEAEKSKEEFRRENIDLLNGEADQFQTLQRLKEQQQTAMTELQQAAAKRDVLARQLKEVQASGDDWTAKISKQDLSQEDARIETLKDKRAELLIKYTDNHPEVIGIEHVIKSLEEQKKQGNKKPQGKESEVITPDKMSNPYVQTLKMGFDNAEADVASYQSLVSALNERIRKIENGLKDRLSIETEMKSLNRDYETISKQYNELLERREQAHITERVDDQTSRLKFKIADPPSRPLKPNFPNRKLFYSLILVGGLVLGFILAFMLYFIRPVFMSTRQLSAVTGLPVLGSVSLNAMESSKDKPKFDWFLIVTLSMLSVGYVAVMLIELLK